jgi:hypothetical protein
MLSRCRERKEESEIREDRMRLGESMLEPKVLTKIFTAWERACKMQSDSSIEAVLEQMGAPCLSNTCAIFLEGYKAMKMRVKR